MKKSKVPVFIPIILAGINAAASAWYLSTVEAEIIPTHYDLYMNPDQYGSKWTLMFFSGMILLLSVFFIVYRATIGKRANNTKNIRYENPFFLIITLVFCGINWFLMLTSTGAIAPDRSWLPALTIVLGLLMLLYGNISGKIKQNFNFGIKFKSTLRNRTVWKKAHRLSGVLCCIGGVIMIICGIIGFFASGLQLPLFAGSLILTLLAGLAIPTIYAAKLYKELGDDGSYEELFAKADSDTQQAEEQEEN
ncbi:MAG: hypothetical protein E7559_03930 [Ruminococcaceae bacterium]|nr:hypothetical protein [Oscillospiraceae bacterium]